jgi:branched-chain amino acid transport system ATP-binding protein
MADILLTTDNLTKEFSALIAVDRVSLEVETNSVSAIIGPNGAGKTTLFNLLTGKLAPTRGTITFRGERIDGLPPHEIVRRGIARSYQITNFFADLTVLENVRLAAQRRHSRLTPRDFLGHYSTKEEALDDAQAALESVDLLEVRDRPAGNLSHGQRRHLEVGIALALDPDLLLLDEPTAGMSPEETHEMKSLLQTIAQDITLVLVEHDMDVVMDVSDKVAVMNRGSLIAYDKPSVVREDEEVQRAYLSGGAG